MAPAPETSELASHLEIAHVLFMDIVAYSTQPMERQRQLLSELQEAVRNTQAFAIAQGTEKLISLPTGDGMALVFFGDPELPVRCALELSRALHEHPEIKLRMGIHTGPVYRIDDINAARNVAGGGINLAQRVMDCGDAGHILVSHSIAEMLTQLGAWSKALQDLNVAEVKHGIHLHIYNLCTEEAGNAELPSKLRGQREAAALTRTKRRRLLAGSVAGILAALIAAAVLYFHRSTTLTTKDTIVIGDFTNSTADLVFDDTLKQALTVQLEQSPFLNVLSTQKVNATLQLMNHPVRERLAPELTREICLRTDSKAMLLGTLAAVGDRYLVTVQAVNCQSGDTIASGEANAKDRNGVLDALEQVGNQLRSKLGESLASVQKFNQPLAEATTSSLEALRAFTQAEGTRVAGDGNPVPSYERAIELDPSFAMAYLQLGAAYQHQRAFDKAIPNLQRAFELRHRASQRERLQIESFYYTIATGEVEKAEEIYKDWIASYPTDHVPHRRLGYVYLLMGRDKEALAEMQQVMRLVKEPSKGDYGNLIFAYTNLDQLHNARVVFEDALAHNVDAASLRHNRYYIAFIEKDSAAMQEQMTWAKGRVDVENDFLADQSDTYAYYGNWRAANELCDKASFTAMKAGNMADAATLKVNQALREALVGNRGKAVAAAKEALTLSTGKNIKAIATLTFALAGDTVEAEKLLSGIGAEFPRDTLLQRYLIPTVRAALDLNKGRADNAIAILELAEPYELGAAYVADSTFGSLVPAYIRGEAYLLKRQGPQAAAEFRKLIQHPGIVINFVAGALAHLQLARAQALSGNKEEARKSYEDFFAIWKDADPTIPILREAKTEYARLN